MRTVDVDVEHLLGELPAQALADGGGSPTAHREAETAKAHRG